MSGHHRVRGLTLELNMPTVEKKKEGRHRNLRKTPAVVEDVGMNSSQLSPPGSIPPVRSKREMRPSRW
jgi:hypothetical protein